MIEPPARRSHPLRPEQQALLDAWVPTARVVADHSWGLVDTVVLELDSELGRLIVKAGGPADAHIARELRAHRDWLAPWVNTGQAPQLLFGEATAKVLVTRYLPGRLVEGSAAQDDPATFHQAGELLARFHAQASKYDPQWNDRFRDRALRTLDRPHRIDPAVERAVRAEVSTWPGGGAHLVPTHGDWQPRNWLIDGSVVRAIDFGRADLRPPTEDFGRVTRQDFPRDARLEMAFLDGYGGDPRVGDQWRRALLGEAIGTAVWAFGVGDVQFEQFGHRLLAELMPGETPPTAPTQ